MFAVIDVNIVFSALITKGSSREVFKANKAVGTFEFFAPDFLFLELGRRLDKLVLQTSLENAELAKAFSLIKSAITVIPLDEFVELLAEAKALNEKDAPYLALAMKLDCPIISGDKELKEQRLVKVLSPAQALDIIHGIAPQP